MSSIYIYKQHSTQQEQDTQKSVLVLHHYTETTAKKRNRGRVGCWATPLPPSPATIPRYDATATGVDDWESNNDNNRKKKKAAAPFT
jgi:hypothetical protein